MADTLYLNPPLLDQVDKFSKDEQAQVVSLLERLSADPIGNSKPLSFKPNGLRVARVGDIRILLNHDPAENLTVVTDIVNVSASTSEAA